MKNFKYLLVLVMTISLATVSCSDDDNDSPSESNSFNPIVGTWAFSGTEEGVSISMEITFNENGTGVMTTSATLNGITESDSENFNWSTSGSTLTAFDEDSDYTIVGNVLTISSEDGILVLTKV